MLALVSVAADLSRHPHPATKSALQLSVDRVGEFTNGKCGAEISVGHQYQGRLMC